MRKSLKKSISTRLIVIISVIIIGIGALISIFPYNSEVALIDNQEIPKAAIIDQLYSDIPNEDFHEKAIEYLEGAGYRVDIFTTNNVTVNLYKNLPEKNYKIVVIRSYGVSEKENDSVSIFTGEKYQEDKYVTEQLFGQLKKGKPLRELVGISAQNNSTVFWSINSSEFFGTATKNGTKLAAHEYFVITPKFVKDSMNGRFQETIFLLAGSYTLENDSMAKSLVDRGASIVLGWDNEITNFDGDKIMLGLLEKILKENVKVKNAIEQIEQEFNSQDRFKNTTLKYYPRT